MLVSLLGAVGTFIFLVLLLLAMIAKLIIIIQSIEEKISAICIFYLILDVIVYMIVLISFALGRI